MALTVRTVPLDQIEVRKQVRQSFNRQSIEELAASIQANGMLQLPLCAPNEDGRLQCICGGRRLRAAKHLGWKEIQVAVASDAMQAQQVLAGQIVENLQRESVDPVAEAEAIAELVRLGGLTGEQVAARLGKTPAFVTRRLALLKLPEVLREQVREGKIAADLGYQLARVTDPEEQASLAAEVADGKLTRDALVRKLRRVKNAGTAKRGKAARVTARLPEGSVTVSAEGLCLDTLIAVLEAAVSRAKKARAQKLSLSTFVKALRDQAVA